MHKREFASELGKAIGIPTNQAVELLDLMLETLFKCVIKDGQVGLGWWGAFKLEEVKRTSYINPNTGKSITRKLPPRVKFIPYEHLKQLCEGVTEE